MWLQSGTNECLLQIFSAHLMNKQAAPALSRWTAFCSTGCVGTAHTALWGQMRCAGCTYWCRGRYPSAQSCCVRQGCQCSSSFTHPFHEAPCSGTRSGAGRDGVLAGPRTKGWHRGLSPAGLYHHCSSHSHHAARMLGGVLFASRGKDSKNYFPLGKCCACA